MGVDTVANTAKFSTPQAGDDAEWWKAVAKAEKEMMEGMNEAKIHIDTIGSIDSIKWLHLFAP